MHSRGFRGHRSELQSAGDWQGGRPNASPPALRKGSSAQRRRAHRARHQYHAYRRRSADCRSRTCPSSTSPTPPPTPCSPTDFRTRRPARHPLHHGDAVSTSHRLAARGLNILVPEVEITNLNGIIYEELCRGIVRDASRQIYVRPPSSGWPARGAEAVILGCTEIGMLIDDDSSPLASVRHHRSARQGPGGGRAGVRDLRHQASSEMPPSSACTAALLRLSEFSSRGAVTRHGTSGAWHAGSARPRPWPRKCWRLPLHREPEELGDAVELAPPEPSVCSIAALVSSTSAALCWVISSICSHRASILPRSRTACSRLAVAISGDQPQIVRRHPQHGCRACPPPRCNQA